jgi:hypothetical protein
MPGRYASDASRDTLKTPPTSTQHVSEAAFLIFSSRAAASEPIAPPSLPPATNQASARARARPQTKEKTTPTKERRTIYMKMQYVLSVSQLARSTLFSMVGMRPLSIY